MDKSGFRLPKQFLTQLGEFSRGYYLAVVNDRGEIDSFECYDNPAIRLALLNFVHSQSSAMQEHLKNQALKMEELADRSPQDEELGEDEEG
jgi:hypothetical protein